MERANASMRVLIWGAGQGGAGVGVYITVNIGIKRTNSVISYVFVAR